MLHIYRALTCHFLIHCCLCVCCFIFNVICAIAHMLCVTLMFGIHLHLFHWHLSEYISGTAVSLNIVTNQSLCSGNRTKIGENL
jgi:hypothetical protein